MDISNVNGFNARIEGALSGLQRARDAEKLGNSKVLDAAERMESLFASILIKEMGHTLPQGFFGEGPGSDVFSSWMEQHLGEELGRSGFLRIAELIRFDMARGGDDETTAEVDQ
jgi:Rod binding domain-containing protein